MYIDAERRFQELEKAWFAGPGFDEVQLIYLYYRRRRSFTMSQRSEFRQVFKIRRAGLTSSDILTPLMVNSSMGFKIKGNS